MKTHFELPKAALSVMTLLEDKGFEVYLIGGYVRDLLIGRQSTDLDMATNASAKAMIEIFNDHPLSLIGEKLGTVGVKIEDTWVELTTYRSESTSSNYRHPDEVRFIGSLKDDVLRRDFTINALALNVYGDLIDYTDGLNDLEQKRIRAIVHPEDRFAEDALRILRALRFSSQLGFSIEAQTAQAMIADQDLVKTLPIERIAAELDKLILADHASEVMRAYPQLIKPWFDYDLEALDKLVHFSDKALRYLCLLNKMGHDEIEKQLTSLKFSKAFIKMVLDLKALSLISTHDRYSIKVLMGQYGNELLDLAIRYQKIMGIAGIDPDTYQKLKSEKPAVTLKMLALNGNDLTELGYTGKEISTSLNALLDLVMNEKIENNREALIKALKKLH